MLTASVALEMKIASSWPKSLNGEINKYLFFIVVMICLKKRASFGAGIHFFSSIFGKENSRSASPITHV